MLWTTPTLVPIVTSDYNLVRLHPVYRYPWPHTGVDFRAYTGTPIRAAAAGWVERSGYDPPRSQKGTGAGNHIRLNHGGGVTTRYYHLSRRDLQVGQRVILGQRIGLAGNTGDSTAAHLHFEIRLNGIHIDPVPYLQDRVTTVINHVGIPTPPNIPTPTGPIPTLPPLEELIRMELGDLVPVENTVLAKYLPEGTESVSVAYLLRYAAAAFHEARHARAAAVAALNTDASSIAHALAPLLIDPIVEGIGTDLGMTEEQIYEASQRAVADLLRKGVG